jgi:predicted double-glycine peptidase
MAIQEKQLGQATPPTAATPVSLYSPAASTTTVIRNITICNTTGSAAKARIYIDNDGTTYSAATAVIYDLSIGANSSEILTVYWPMDDENGNIAVESDTNAALTFTAFGLEIT